MKFLMTMMIHQLSVTSNKVSSQLISPQNWPVFIFPLTQSEPDIYHLNSNQSLKKFPVVLTCTYFSFYLSSGPRGIFYYLESITWSFHNHMCLLHYSRLNSSHSKDIYVKTFFCHNAGLFSTGSGILAVLVSLRSLRSASSVCLLVVESRQVALSCNPGLKISDTVKAHELFQCAKVKHTQLS